MENLEVGHLGLVSGFHEGFKSCLDQCRGAAAENGLLAEKIGLGLFLEGGLENSRACAADALGPCEGGLLGFAALVLIDGDEGGDALAFLILAADRMTGALRRNHDDVDVLRRLDRLEVNGKSVTEEQGMTGVEIRCDVLLVDLGDGEVGNGNEDHISLLYGLGSVKNFEAELLGDSAALALGIETYDDLDSALLEIEGMSVSLGTKADNGAGFSLEELQIGIFVSIDFSGHGLVVCCGLKS